ncbi:unnamed protein product [Somion occarium]|uniref:Uncharacterized protein n=1 Tax=Somion occarium TaxID=3059160 RepID=A0ABP1E7K8_9APHY
MPTVPPTCVSLTSLEDEGVMSGVFSSQISIGTSPNGPTPDPDLDDVELVPVVTGDGMGAITESISLGKAPNHRNREMSMKMKPRLSLGDISLHSPSSILGTPFDVSSPKFEYPFPLTVPESGIITPPSSIPSISSPLSFFPDSNHSIMSSALPPSMPNHTPKSHQPSTHMRLPSRDPPVPPGLAKKRRSVVLINPPVRQRVRVRSPSVAIPPMKEKSAGEKVSSRSISVERKLQGEIVIPENVVNKAGPMPSMDAQAVEVKCL